MLKSWSKNPLWIKSIRRGSKLIWHIVQFYTQQIEDILLNLDNADNWRQSKKYPSLMEKIPSKKCKQQIRQVNQLRKKQDQYINEVRKN